MIIGDMESVDRLNELLELSANRAFDGERQLTYIDQIYQVIDIQRTDSITTQEAETFTLTGRNSDVCLLYTSPSPRDRQKSRMPSSA